MQITRLQNVKTRIFLLCIIFVISVFIITKLTYGFIPIPLWARHICHLVFPPSDLLDPIVIDDFAFWDRGFSKTFSLKPKYLDIYALGILFDSPVPKNFSFDGKIKIEFFCKETNITEKLIDSPECYFGGGLECFKGVVLTEFDVPFQQKYLKKIYVKVTVLEPIKDLVVFRNKMKLFIAVSPRS